MSKDLHLFFSALDQACEVLGRPTRSEHAKEMYMDVLSHYPVKTLIGALNAHMRDPDAGRFVPAPAHLVAQIEKAMAAKDGRPDAEEAWSIALCAADENDTVVWTIEIAQAWDAVVHVMPDKVAARMAFKSVYERLVREAKERHDKVVWYPSLGHDKERRTHALENAVRLGRMGKSQAESFLPAPEPTHLLTDQSGTEPQAAAEWLGRLKQMLGAPKREAVSQDKLNREKTAQAKAQTQAKVDRYMQEGGGGSVPGV